MKDIIIPISGNTRLVCKDWVNIHTEPTGIRVVIEKKNFVEADWHTSSTLYIDNEHMSETFNAIARLEKLLVLK